MLCSPAFCSGRLQSLSGQLAAACMCWPAGLPKQARCSVAIIGKCVALLKKLIPRCEVCCNPAAVTVCGAPGPAARCKQVPAKRSSPGGGAVLLRHHGSGSEEQLAQ